MSHEKIIKKIASGTLIITRKSFQVSQNRGHSFNLTIKKINSMVLLFFFVNI